jgi:hypothetical protein
LSSASSASLSGEPLRYVFTGSFAGSGKENIAFFILIVVLII